MVAKGSGNLELCEKGHKETSEGDGSALSCFGGDYMRVYN